MFCGLTNQNEQFLGEIMEVECSRQKRTGTFQLAINTQFKSQEP